MSKIMQNLVVLMEEHRDGRPDVISSKGGNMCLNKFCIDEDAAFEFSGVQNLEKPESKGKGWLSLRKTIFECLIDYKLEALIV